MFSSYCPLYDFHITSISAAVSFLLHSFYQGHAVLNTQDSIAVASELKKSNFRIPLPRAFQDLSPNARKGPPPGNV